MGKITVTTRTLQEKFTVMYIAFETWKLERIKNSFHFCAQHVCFQLFFFVKYFVSSERMTFQLVGITSPIWITWRSVSKLNSWINKILSKETCCHELHHNDWEKKLIKIVYDKFLSWCNFFSAVWSNLDGENWAKILF